MQRIAAIPAGLLGGLTLAFPAAAHHVSGGMMPTGFAEGFLSGLAHPLIGLDHLGFILAVGLAAGIARLGAAVPATFVGASLLGVLLHGWAPTGPAVEILVALSVAAAGGALAAGGRALPAAAWTALAALAGLVHGVAYGETVTGAEPTPVIAYLLGLGLVQGAIAAGLARLGRRWSAAGPAGAGMLAPRLAGATILGVGIATLAAGTLPGG
ncbi:HupE/UreJ family protein [Paracraurococcus lichenis]|uniref:HupE/UreJ family protein n=1 Tax=Paracraurococcus lichenis TaxID=3064888 RepID=A0ABT9E0V7_9PROT|nr:HupE/UreJ family protein [Paracraurococcus sp. LOR1-02]MDO9709752.1 HupE/UreJ family protein [Paracraurococcus sp. LOR1-02]